jgi:hypothetical protein
MNANIHDWLLFGHLVSLVVGFGAVIVVDSFGLAWLLKLFGVSLELVTKVANITQKLIWLGFVGLVGTGIPMLVAKGYPTDLVWVKLFLVAMVGVNGVFLHTIKQLMEKEATGGVSRDVMFRIALASTVSQVGWWGATIIGFVSKEVKNNPQLPISPISIMCLLVAGIAIFWAVGATWANQNKVS